MSRFQKLTRHLANLNEDTIGEWITDKVNNGTLEHPIHMPYVNYSEVVSQFIDDVYEFSDNNRDFELTQYGEILIKNGLEWGVASMSNADVSDLDAQCVLALIMGAVRAERFCDGALLGFFKDGSINKWLKRLREIDGGAE